MYYHFAIMQEAGRQAHARRDRNARVYGEAFSTPRPKRVGSTVSTGQKEALGDYIFDRYPIGHKQYAGFKFEWRSSRSMTSAWREDDGADPGTRGREWSAVITLKNGAAEHTVRVLAWQERKVA